MKPYDFKYRTSEQEVMDDFYLQGEKLRKTLRDLEKVNRWLGGNKITLEGIKKLLPVKSNATIKILDVGCGDGAMLREIATYGKQENLNLNLLGIDANSYAIEIAKEVSRDHPEIAFETLNIYSEAFERKDADIILCTLTLHHFSDEQIKKLLDLFLRNSRLGIVINDLERSPLAYHLFKGFCAVFIRNEIARKDGLISIRRGFRRRELIALGENFKVKQEINWKWAFRFQWIFYKH